MKKIYTLLSVILMSCLASFGQPAGTMAPPSFSTCHPTLLQNGGDPTQNLFGTDKNTPTITKTVQLFEIQSTANFTIVGAVVWIGYLKVNGTPGNVSFDVVNFCGWTGMNLGLMQQNPSSYPNQYCPDATVGTPKTMSTSALTASACLDNANVIVFDTPIPINSTSGNTCTMNKIGLGVDCANIGDDELGVYSTNFNEGALGTNNQYKELAWQYEPSTGFWYSILASTMDPNTKQPVVNADMLVFPIIDMNVYNAGANTNVCAGSGGVTEQEAFFNGMKLSQSYPNPSKDNCLINYETEKNSTITLSIYDMQGKRVRFYEEGNKTAGKYSININVADLESGNYIYALSSDGKILAKRMELVK